MPQFGTNRTSTILSCIDHRRSRRGMGSEIPRYGQVTGTQFVTGAAPASQIPGKAMIDRELTTHNKTFVTAKSPVDCTFASAWMHTQRSRGHFPRYFKVSP